MAAKRTGNWCGLNGSQVTFADPKTANLRTSIESYTRIRDAYPPTPGAPPIQAKIDRVVRRLEERLQPGGVHDRLVAAKCAREEKRQVLRARLQRTRGW